MGGGIVAAVALTIPANGAAPSGVISAFGEHHIGGAPSTRVATDDRLPLDGVDFEALLGDPTAFAGTAVDQVRRVVARVDLIVARFPEAASVSSEVRV